LTSRDIAPAVARLGKANRIFLRAYPGESPQPQPVHTFYGGAHLFRADTVPRLGRLALAALDDYAPDAASLDAALGVGDLASTVRERVVTRLRRQPVEDYRIDFEDGYGYRPDAEEDGHAESAALEVAQALASGALPSGIGLRIKPMSQEAHGRSLRTLDLFVTTLARATRSRLPDRFFVTIPKVTRPEHVGVVASVCRALERKLRLPSRSLRIEIMIETPQSVIAADGSVTLARLVAAGDGRVTGAHFGTYDYTALCGITAAWQHMRHPVCDTARHLMQVALAQTGVQISDGGTNIMPVPVHRPEGRELTARELAENRDAVHRAWKVHFDDITHSLRSGFYQGWDLHPAQLPTRYAAVYAFYLSALDAATRRLRAFVDKAAQATLLGDVFDDAATGQGLLNFFVRGIDAGALTPDEAAQTGLTRAELAGRSFVNIVNARASARRR
jgi:citrate lyase beta subunit